ncbi:hypothetical protein [Moraxella porci]|uniref:hypothetical protein n=1 Tax=Moraxella porci TaxID=1288392 RepID=UPI0024497BC3|nr:hypothetical protein [Moraxella porci]MDH2273280.1 hypothetical protein [Moraxella porci]
MPSMIVPRTSIWALPFTQEKVAGSIMAMIAAAMITSAVKRVSCWLTLTKNGMMYNPLSLFNLSVVLTVNFMTDSNE